VGGAAVLLVEVPRAATVRITAVSDRADVPGVFETELHESGATLPNLEVR
jgi:hypothetical protein